MYNTLATMTPSAVVKVNRAVAVAMAWGAQEGFQLLLRRTDQREAAAQAYERALALCGNKDERAYLQRRLAEMLHQ